MRNHRLLFLFRFWKQCLLLQSIWLNWKYNHAILMTHFHSISWNILLIWQRSSLLLHLVFLNSTSKQSIYLHARLLRSAAPTFFVILLTFIYFCRNYLIENNSVIIVYLTFALTRISKSAFTETLIMWDLDLTLINWEFSCLLLLGEKILRNICR